MTDEPLSESFALPAYDDRLIRSTQLGVWQQLVMAGHLNRGGLQFLLRVLAEPDHIDSHHPNLPIVREQTRYMAAQRLSAEPGGMPLAFYLGEVDIPDDASELDE